MNYTLTEIEDAVVNQLASGALLGMFPGIMIRPYYGEVLPQLIDQLAGGHPACLVTFGGKIFGTENVSDFSQFDYEETVTVILANKNLRSREDSVKGGVSGSGIYDMIEEVQRILSGSNLGLQITPLRPAKIEAFQVEASLSVFVFDFKFQHVYSN